MNERKRLPCPFCGSSNMNISLTVGEALQYDCVVSCRLCDARIIARHGLSPDDAERAALAAWNRRTAPKPEPKLEPAPWKPEIGMRVRLLGSPDPEQPIATVLALVASAGVGCVYRCVYRCGWWGRDGRRETADIHSRELAPLEPDVRLVDGSPQPVDAPKKPPVEPPKLQYGRDAAVMIDSGGIWHLRRPDAPKLLLSWEDYAR